MQDGVILTSERGQSLLQDQHKDELQPALSQTSLQPRCSGSVPSSAAPASLFTDMKLFTALPMSLVVFTLQVGDGTLDRGEGQRGL